MPDDPHPVFPVPPARVVQLVAEAYGLTTRAVTAGGYIDSSSTRAVGAARRVAFSLLHDECWLTWTAVAGLMGLSINSVGTISKGARAADPEAVAIVRARLHLNGDQGSLW